MNIGKFTNNSEKPFHSSGYAKVANGDAIGSTSSESFSQRRMINRYRRAVGNYGDSHVARGGSPGVRGSVPRTSRVEKPAQPPRGFVEPPVRKYNPYQ